MLFQALNWKVPVATRHYSCGLPGTDTEFKESQLLHWWGEVRKQDLLPRLLPMFGLFQEDSDVVFSRHTFVCGFILFPLFPMEKG